MTPSEKKLDKSKLKISSMKDTSDLGNSKETRGLSKWANRQNAMRMHQIETELKEKFGISYTDLKGQISSYRAEKNRLTGELSKKKRM